MPLNDTPERNHFNSYKARINISFKSLNKKNSRFSNIAFSAAL